MTGNEMVNNDNDSRKIITMIILIGVLMLCTTGATYAYFAISAVDNSATGTAATAKLELTVTQVTLKTPNTGVMVPQLETALSSAINSSNNCVDDNGNIVCKVYSVTIKNSSTSAVKIIGYIQFSGIYGGSNEATKLMPHLKMKRITDATVIGSNTAAAVGGGTSSTLWDIIGTSGKSCIVNTENESDKCTVKPLGVGASETYYFVVWINEINDVQTDSGTWRATISFQGENGLGVTSTIRS